MEIIKLIIPPFFNIYCNTLGVLECIITNNFVLFGRYTEWGCGNGGGDDWLMRGGRERGQRRIRGDGGEEVGKGREKERRRG